MADKNRLVPLAGLCIVLLASCGGSETLGDAQFWAFNTTTERYYKVSADKLVEGKKCVIWAEVGSGVTGFLAQQIATEYDNNIRQIVVDALSEKPFTDKHSNLRFSDILDYANALASRNDGKLTILLLDIKDNYLKNKSYVAGYFDLTNFFPTRMYQNSNVRDMIYIDTMPGLDRGLEQMYVTLAHELQHLVNFVSSYQHRVENDTIYPMDTWIDEGLSAYIEYLYLGEDLSRIEWFSRDPEETIAKGNNFFVWGNYTNKKPNAILDDYATVYLFFRWLSLHANTGLRSHFLKDIITSENYNHLAVTTMAKNINPEWDNWETLLRTWLAANYYPKDTTYGYKNNNFNEIKVNPISGSKISLFPGEGVYSILGSSISPSTAGKIKYAGLSDVSSDIRTNSPFSSSTSKVLLTYNINTVNGYAGANVVPEDGTLTGVSASVSPSASLQQARSALTDNFTGPYKIGARDLLGRGEGKIPSIPIPFRNDDE